MDEPEMTARHCRGARRRGTRSPLLRTMSRRRFLRAVGAAGLVAIGCGEKAPGEGITPSASPSRVAVAWGDGYDRALLRQEVRDLLDSLGGLDDLVSPGDRVAIKVNLTGGTTIKPISGVSPIESYVTHPEVVRALGEALRDAGARELLIVEAVYEEASYRLWGYHDLAEALDATLIDLNSPHPHSDFSRVPVGEGWFIYQDFAFHPILQEIDVFVSVAKMKCHWSCGVTHSMKNLIGLVPASHYRLDPTHAHRSALHGRGDEFKTRLPRVIIDLNRARPIHLALIDGIKTAEAGEGPWIKGMAPVEPGLLVAGRDPVATDAVATAIMGFDPTAAPPTAPFLRSDNHLHLARLAGLGTNRLEEIDVVGPAIEEVGYTFRPASG